MNKKKVFGFALLGAGLLGGVTLLFYLKEKKRVEELNKNVDKLDTALSAINSIK
jgi:hypothetical protein